MVRPEEFIVFELSVPDLSNFWVVLIDKTVLYTYFRFL